MFGRPTGGAKYLQIFYLLLRNIAPVAIWAHKKDLARKRIDPKTTLKTVLCNSFGTAWGKHTRKLVISGIYGWQLTFTTLVSGVPVLFMPFLMYSRRKTS